MENTVLLLTNKFHQMVVFAMSIRRNREREKEQSTSEQVRRRFCVCSRVAHYRMPSAFALSQSQTTQSKNSKQNDENNIMPKLLKRFAMFQRKPTPKSPSYYVSYAPEVLVDEDIESPAFQRDFPASFAAAKANTNEASIEAPANGDVVSSDMISSNAVGFVETAFKSAFGHQHDATSCNLLARANVQSCTQQQYSHTSFPSTSYFCTGLGITWEVYGDETAVDSSAVVVASHVVKSDNRNKSDVFLSFVFKENTVTAIIQHGDGESAHEAVLERFRMTSDGRKALPYGSYNTVSASASSPTDRLESGKFSLLLIFYHIITLILLLLTLTLQCFVTIVHLTRRTLWWTHRVLRWVWLASSLLTRTHTSHRRNNKRAGSSRKDSRSVAATTKGHQQTWGQVSFVRFVHSIHICFVFFPG